LRSGIVGVLAAQVGIRLLRSELVIAEAVFDLALRGNGTPPNAPPVGVIVAAVVGHVSHVAVLSVGVGIVIAGAISATLAHRGVRRRAVGQVHDRRGAGATALVDAPGGVVHGRVVGVVYAAVRVHRGGRGLVDRDHALRRRAMLLRRAVVGAHGRGGRRGGVGRDRLLLPTPDARAHARTMRMDVPSASVVPIVVVRGVIGPPQSSRLVMMMLLLPGRGIVAGLGRARLDLALLPVDDDVSGLARDGRE
jgi:hypothetical protein